MDERWRFSDTHRERAPRQALHAAAAALRIDEAETRDEVVEALLALCLRFFRRVAFFIVREPWVIGWNGAGEGMDRTLAMSLKIPLDRPSVFKSVTRDKTVFVGRLGPEEENQRFLKALAKRPASGAALFPVAMKGRVVNLVYGDSGASGNVKPDLGEFLVLLQKVPRAYLRIVRKRIAETRKATGAGPGEEERESE